MNKKNLYDGPLNSSMDFAAAGPNGEPASGLAVQNYIKGRIGFGCVSGDGSEYLFFADETAKNMYMEDPSDPSLQALILATIPLEPEYTVAINLISPAFCPVFLGDTGNSITYTFSTTTKSGDSFSEGVVATYSISRGSMTRTVTETYRPGATVSFNLDDYLLEGSNMINISIRGLESGITATKSVTYQVINLSLTSTFDVSTVYAISSSNQNMAVPYTLEGTDVKTMEWYVDGVRIPLSQEEDVITEQSASRTKYIPINGLAQGRHSLQFRVSVSVSGETFYSGVLYREFIINTGLDGNPVVVLAANLPVSAGLLDAEDAVRIYAIQYETLNLRVAAWNPDKTCYQNTVTATSGAIQIGSVVCEEGRESVLPLSFSNSGLVDVVLSVEGQSRTVSVNVAQTDMNISEITSGLDLAFSASGRTNDSPNRDSWTDGTHTATFTGFEWIATSGWDDGKLHIPSGASLSFDYAPLASDVTSTGKTFEFDFRTVNVDDEEAVLMNLMTGDGAGIKLTATQILVRSTAGETLFRRFKQDEDVRVSVVINPHSGVVNKNLLFVYFNGIVSMATSFSDADDFITNANLSVGGIGADIVLKQIRIYNNALSSASILNNYILYRDTIAQMNSVYRRNDLYEAGTSNFDVDKIAATLPVMVITGNIPAIEATTDKNLSIVADIKYINLQDTTRSFVLKNAIVKGQGTSSMTYPKKNLRFYTRASDNTVLYDYQGNVVTDRLYSFKKNAQPVDCWCLKTDFAESSGTHNTGIARLWNDKMKSALLDGEYALRTEAQQLAVDNHYQYDVRTTVDGFPIVVLYHLTENDPLIFLGKYNFNNDKSTESVFGFTQFIPQFDNSNVECWEFLDSGNQLALFQTTTGWDTETTDPTTGKKKKGWEYAWEARYPDKNKDTTALKSLAEWIVSTQSDLQEWTDNKEEHFDLPKLAAYYVYLMRFGAVDQTVKNAMITTEDGVHWYFINYDNDTILGVRNDGLLRYSPDIDRQSTDPELSRPGEPYYAYAGHGSVLWNNFEADPECMAMAARIDAALYSAGLTYDSAIEMFNDLQSGKWAESIYNQDAQYKYIGPWVNEGLRYLGSLQGSRSDHRKWWLANRFAFYDAFFVNGAYMGNNIHFLAPMAPAGKTFTITAGKRFYYGYGRDSVPKSTGVLLDAGDTHTFTTDESLEIGTAIRIYAPYYIEKLDISDFCQYIGAANFDLSAAFSDTLGSKMKELVLGNANKENNALQGLSGIGDIISLEKLNVEGYKALLSLNLSTLVNLQELHAYASGLRSVTFADGAPLSVIELPSTMQSLDIRNNPTIDNFMVLSENNFGSIRSMHIEKCPLLMETSVRYNPQVFRQTIVKIWLDTLNPSEYGNCSLYIDGLNTSLFKSDTNTLYTKIKALKDAGASVTLYGKILISEADNWTQEELDELNEYWGGGEFNVFSKNAPLYFYSSTPIMSVEGKTTIHLGDTVQYRAWVLGAPNDARYIYQLNFSDPRVNITMDSTGLLTSTEVILPSPAYATGTLTIQYIGGGETKTKTITITAYNRVYPAASRTSIVGEDDNVYVSRQTEFELVVGAAWSGDVVDGNYTTVWSVSGDLAQYLTLTKIDDEHCNIIVSNSIPDITSSATLTATVTRDLDGEQCCVKTKTIYYQDESIAVSAVKNPEVVRVLHEHSLCASSDYVTKAEAAEISDIQLKSTANQNYKSIFNFDSQFRSNCTNFEELKYFTLLTDVPDLAYCYYITKICLPPNAITIHIENTAFTEGLYIPSTISSVNIRGSRIRWLDLTDFSGYVGYQSFYDTRVKRLIVGSNTKFSSLGGPPLFDNSGLSYLKEVFVYDGNEYFEPGTNLYSKYHGSNDLYVLGNGNRLPEDVKTISSYAAYEGAYIYETLSVPNVTGIGVNAFAYCRNIVTITNCSNLTQISDFAFYYCSSITSVSYLENLVRIYQYGFAQCASLSSIRIGSKIVEIRNYAFSNCTNLSSITIEATTPPTLGSYVFSSCSALAAIYVPASVVDTYKAATGWIDYASIIQAIPEE